jgi:F0F1-type ATP synthase membrane subunit b/b'
LYILASVPTQINSGDVLFQLIMFCILFVIPLAIVVSFVILRNRNNRLKRVEEKLDKILSDKK